MSVMNLSSSECFRHHMNSARYPAWSPRCVPYDGIWTLVCPPITFYGICAGSIVSVNKFLRMIYSDMRVPYLCQVSVGLPTVAMYYWPWSNPLLNKWQESSGLSVMNWDHEDFVLVVFFHVHQTPTGLQLCGHDDISSFQIYFCQSQLPLHYHLFVHFVPSLNRCNIPCTT